MRNIYISKKISAKTNLYIKYLNIKKGYMDASDI